MDGVEDGRPELRLRQLSVDDEQHARQTREELAREGFTFLHDFRDAEPWPMYLHRLGRQQRGIDLPTGWVPASSLVAEAEGQIVGCVSIRHELTASLAEVGGHIGYAVRPAFRRRGYATEILRQALDVARSVGVERALVTCDTDNVASAKVIEKCGGALEGVAPARDGSAAKRRYWIDCAAGGQPLTADPS